MSNFRERIAALSPEKRQLLVQQLERQRQKVAPTQITPQSRDSQALPLSFGQLRLWFLDRLEPGNPFYNIPAAVRLKGKLNVAALERSINEIIRRHEVLRTAFKNTESSPHPLPLSQAWERGAGGGVRAGKVADGQPILAITPSLSLSLTVLDLRQLPESDRESEVRRLATEEAERPFDLKQAPLLRASLLHLEESEYVLLFTMHHIVSDGWSMGILVRELSLLYEAFSSDRPSPLPELPIQYADFACWQRQWLQGEELNAQMSYWKQQLGGSLPVLELPTDRPRPAVQTFPGAVQTLVLPQELTEQLTQLSKQEGTTLFITLLAAFKILLYRYTRQTDILVGSPIANRDRPEIEGLIGFFINTLVLRTNLSNRPSVRELLSRVKEVALEAYDRQNLPFEKLVEELQPERNLSHTPLFQVMFIFQSAQKEVLELSGLTLQPIEVDPTTAKFDLTLSIVDTEGELTANLEYNTDLFDRSTISRMLGHFQTLLSGMATNPQQRISELPMLTQSEQHQLLVEWSGRREGDGEMGRWGDGENYSCIHQLFERQVKRTPEAIALVFEDQQLTYRELNDRAERLCDRLQQLGVGPEVLVGICVERSLEMVVGLLAILKAGGAYVPLDPAYPQERLAFMLSDSQVPILLTQSHLLPTLPEHNAQTVYLDSSWEEDVGAQSFAPLPTQNTTNLAYVIYTSGSTGKPKGVQISHGALVNFLNAMRLTLGVTDKDTLLSVTTLSFDIAALEIYLPLIVGARLVVVSREVAADGTQLLATMANSSVTVMQATPATWQLLLTAGWQGSGKLKILCGGEALHYSLAHQLLERGSEVWNLYGPTETTIWSSAHKVETQKSVDSGYSLVPIGRPIANTQFYVLDPNLQPVPVGVWGELYIGGAGLARGYLDRPELTAEKFVSNPFNRDRTSRLYKTGDVVCYRSNGAIEYQGRLDYQVKVRGFRIELGEIEAVLSQHPEVLQAVVAVRENEPGSQPSPRPSGHPSPKLGRGDGGEGQPGFANRILDRSLVAYLVPQPDRELNISRLRDFLKDKLPQYMVPTAFVLLEALPLTPNGKVDRRALPAPAATRPELEKPLTAPRTPIEEVLATIWLNILGLEALGIDDNFFELGGHSLLATQVVSQVRSLFQVEIPLRWLFESPTVAQLSDRLANLISATPEPATLPITGVPHRTNLPLSFAQQRLWFLDQLQPNNTAYNMPVALRLVGNLNLAALEQSLNEIIRRHEVLRTNFAVVDGEPVQVIAHPHPACGTPLPWERGRGEGKPGFAKSISHQIPPTPLKQGGESKIQNRQTLKLPAIDLQMLPKAEREAKALDLANAEANLPFNLAQDRLIRGKLLKLGATEHIILLTMHHIVYDAWSEGVLIREITALYEAFSAGKPSPLPELPIQYADFASWQRQWLQGELLERLLSYWQKQLAGATGGIDFKSWPVVQRCSGVEEEGKTSFLLNPDLTTKLHELSRQEGVTLFMTLLALLQTLLYRYSDREDIVVGTDIANRDRAELEPLIGFFVNLLVMRTSFAGNPSFRELLARVREVALGAYTHQDLPFAKLVEVLQPERSSSHTPLFEVLFVFQNTPDSTLNLGDLTVSSFNENAKTGKFDLVLFATETSEGIEGNWQYNPEIFNPSAIAQISQHFETLVNDAIANPNTRINSLEIMTQAEKIQQTLTEEQSAKSKFQKFKSIKPKAVNLPQGELVKTGYLEVGETLPLVIQPNLTEFDVANWAKNNRSFIETELYKHGGILFRRFELKSVTDFENFAGAICPQLFGEYGDLPREGVSAKVYGSTPYPSDRAILFHNESSHLNRYPLKIWFFCIQPAAKGGETPIVDCRQVYKLLNPKLREIFARKQLMYVRNYIEGLDVSWQDFFHTNDKTVVEDRCRQAGIDWEWVSENHLRTRTIRPAIIQHPQTGETSFFNQLQLHHISCLEPSVRSSLLSVFAPENLPRHVYYGDGSPIEDSVIEEIMAVYQQATRSFPWQQGDVLMLDNILSAHGRNPYEGSRKIVVAMGEITHS